MPPTRKEMIATARAEARSMRDGADRTPEGAMIRVPPEHFTKIAAMIDCLCELSAFNESAFAASNYWVPLPHFERLREEAEHLASTCEQLRQKPRLWRRIAGA